MDVSTTLLRHRHAAPEPTLTPAPPPAQAPSTGHGQVFVDDSGRRRRIVRRFAIALAVGAVLYLAAVVGALGDTSVRPGVEVPADAGNGQVAGFPQDPGTPGLLTARPAGEGFPDLRPRDPRTANGNRRQRAGTYREAGRLSRVKPPDWPARRPARPRYPAATRPAKMAAADPRGPGGL